MAFAVEIESTSTYTVSITAYQCSEKLLGRMQIPVDRAVSEDDIGHCSVGIGDKQRNNDSAIIGDAYFGSVTIGQLIERYLFSIDNGIEVGE
jgi:hypothetical protein